MRPVPDPNRYNHKESRYERPKNRYRCGRARIWGKSCHLGPTQDGQCGGTTECLPVATNNGAECRRPNGACDRGPMPNGSCRHRHTPCTPILSAKIQRTRLNLVAAILMLALISISWWPVSEKFDVTNQNDINATFVSPGELSSTHQAFTASIGCGACHDGHLSMPSPWQIHFSQAENKIDCTSCHNLVIGETSPHNKDERTNACYRCHTLHDDHQEEVELSDRQCITCHKEDFHSFDQHSPFGENFPHGHEPSIVFDHAKHFEFDLGPWVSGGEMRRTRRNPRPRRS